MNVRAVEQLTEVERVPPPLIHAYPCDPDYRLSGMLEPQPGDIARCGWVKVRPYQPGDERLRFTCVVCRDLVGRL